MTRSQLTREELFQLAGEFLTERGGEMGQKIPIARVQAWLCQFWDEVEIKAGERGKQQCEAVSPGNGTNGVKYRCHLSLADHLERGPQHWHDLYGWNDEPSDPTAGGPHP